MRINKNVFYKELFKRYAEPGLRPSMCKDMTGKTVVITGSTSGIGLATAVKLAGEGASLIGVGRSEARIRMAEEAVKKVYNEADITYMLCDLSSLNQVRELAEQIKEKVKINGKIDVLINAAGTFSSWYTGTVDGFELQFAVNHLAPFLLTNELMPLLKKGEAGRVIMVSSGSHYRTSINWNDIMLRKHYNCLMAYKQSKLANVLFAAELNRRLGGHSNVRAFAADPGLVNTDIGIKRSSGIAKWVWEMRSRRGTDPSVPASAIAYLACEPSIQQSPHVYWKDCKPLMPSRYSQRQDAARKLWEISERMCGIKSSDYGIDFQGNNEDSYSMNMA